MPSFILTDVHRDLWVEDWSISAADLGHATQPNWSVAKRALKGGRRHGVDLIRIDNGALELAVVPTRGMGLWKGRFKQDPLGWRSPIADGPVNPAFVNLNHWGGLGWLEGFDELLARCGLETNGAPYEEKVVNPDGSSRHIAYTLHGKIANIPAHHVAVHIDDQPPHAITIEGRVDETKLFGPKVRMTTTITTIPGSNRATVRDSFLNLGDQPTPMRVLYHWNFGAPFLEGGSRLVVPAKTVVPRNDRAIEGLGHYDTYGPPEPGFAEQVYFFELHGSGPEGSTLALLRDRAGARGIVLRFAKAQLPYFTLWKNTGGAREGYVTGLEPGTNYPNPTPFETERGRLATLEPGKPFVAETILEALDNPAAVAAIEAEIKALQALGAPTIHPRPVEPFTG